MDSYEGLLAADTLGQQCANKAKNGNSLQRKAVFGRLVVWLTPILPEGVGHVKTTSQQHLIAYYPTAYPCKPLWLT